ncbi:hypothetical protein R1sor_022103 [Riccia sorocarpa]|uniref:poly(ADP-ribose) glycohydrolase n=1 Tax=Riccia sorocarpa TaxID=122646 RepID=A0ABD3GLW7_9MARC
MSAAQFSSISQYLPLQEDPSSGDLRWAQSVEDVLTAVALGPDSSLVSSGQALCDCIIDMRGKMIQFWDFSAEYAESVRLGLTQLFDALEDAKEFFTFTLPGMATLALQLPELLKEHVEEASNICGDSTPLKLRVLNPQQSGMVLLQQRLIAAILACAFFCLYPGGRTDHDLRPISFDSLFVRVPGKRHQVEKIKCLIHYFQEVCSSMPQGRVSFERKVLPRRRSHSSLRPVATFPDELFWKRSQRPLCAMKVVERGGIEDAGPDYLQADFANRYLGGGALRLGCVQEEIRFMIIPELIAGMLFMSPMAENESIEITGAQQYSGYKGYASSFMYAGSFVDTTPTDSWGRRRTCLTAIDALCRPGEAQFEVEMVLREVNKAFCGFLPHSALCGAVEIWKSDDKAEASQTKAVEQEMIASMEKLLKDEPGEGSSEGDPETSCSMHQVHKGVATGNWGCGAFGGNLHLKCLLQWIAASEAGRSEVLYYTFRDERAEKLQEVIDWILEKRWPICRLWTVIAEYAKRRLKPQGGLKHMLKQKKHTPKHTKHIPKQELFDWILANSGSGSSS